MRIVVSGTAGFLGSHLVDLLLDQGHDVVGIDNFITGRPENIAHVTGNPRFTLLRSDITEFQPVSGTIDRIYHLASPASPVAYASHRVATMKTNSQGTWNLLELAVQKDARFLVTSTSEIYGEPALSPQPEAYWGHVNPIGLRSMYEEAKRFAEALTMAYHRERRADTRIVRLYSAYGPRMHPADGRVVTNFVRQALAGEPITVLGDGTQSRSFCYVSDTVRGINLAMEADFLEPINIGNPQQTTILQLARDIIDLVPGTKSKVSFEPRPDYDPHDRCPDIMRARQILGWSPQVPRKEGLARTIEYQKSSLRP